MRFSAWKYPLILVVLVFSSIYALPNLWPDAPAVQISGATASTQITTGLVDKADRILKDAGVEVVDAGLSESSGLIQLKTPEAQLKAQELLKRGLGQDYVVALNFAQTTPSWLRALGAKPMKLGLDLRGGVHFLLEVDQTRSLEQRLETSINDAKRVLRQEKVSFTSFKAEPQGFVATFRSDEERDQALRLLKTPLQNFSLNPFLGQNGPALQASFTQAAIDEISQYAVDQNLTTLRNRINELGVSEAVVQTQGANRILIELPGVQDTAEAKRVIGRTANLEFRLVAPEAANYTGGPAPVGTEAFEFKDTQTNVLLSRQIIVTGDRVQNAQAGRDQNGGAKVDITLDTAGGRAMQQATTGNVGTQMAVLFIETKQRITYLDDEATGETKEIRTPYVERTVINQATIQAVLGSQFQITGLDSAAEASELALLLRAGALAAPMNFVEERTIGPSLGQENIEKGVKSTIIGFLAVAVFMLLYYRMFGLFANIALFMNLAMMFAAMSLIGAVLSLPGIAGIVLTIGMAVDANVLIYERIREELATGASPKHAIVAGYDRAFGTIFDSNLTTFIVAFLLFAVGSGPIKGFAVTLSIGILCSMFTAIVVTRALAQIVYGRPNVSKLSV